MRITFLVLIILLLLVSSAPAYDLTQPLSLADCIEIALEKNPQQRQSELSAQSAAKGVTRAFSNFLPSASISANYQKTGGERLSEQRTGVDSLTGEPIYEQTVIDLESESSGLNLSVRQTVFNGGYNLANLSYAKHDAKAAEYNRDYAKNGLILSIKQYYFSLLKSQQLLKVSEEDLALSAKQLELAEALNEVGSAAKSDVLRAKATVAQKKLSLLTAQNNVNLGKADLAAAMGIDVSADLTIVDIEPLISSETENLDVEQLFSQAFEQRLDLKASEAGIDRAQSNVGMARSDYLPSLSLGANYGYNDDEFKIIGENKGWSYSASLSYNLFDGFSREAGYQQARISERSAKQAYAQKKIDVALEVKQATLNLQTAGERIKQAEESLKAAEEDLRLAEERYRLGVATIVDLNTAQLGYTDAKTSHVEAIYDYELQKARLEFVIGK